MALRFVLLSLLSKRPNTGYGAGRLLRGELRHVWEARLQQIYSELARLQADGLVEVERFDLANRPAKKVYSLTARGEAELRAWLTRPSGVRSTKDQLLVKLYCLERQPPELVVRHLEARREQSQGEASRLRDQLAQTPRADPAQLGQLITLEAALARAEAEAAWCGRVLAILGGRPVEPAVDASAEQERRASAP